jgi:hypothetical protein
LSTARHHITGGAGGGDGNGASGSPLSETKAALVAMAEEADELQQAVGGSVTDALAGWLGPQYAMAARAQLAELKGEDRLKLLRAFVQDWALLRQGDQTAQRLEIDRERVVLERERTETHLREQFEEWLKDPGAKRRLCGEGLSPEERERRMREIFDLPEKGKGGISAETLKKIERELGIM